MRFIDIKLPVTFNFTLRMFTRFQVSIQLWARLGLHLPKITPPNTRHPSQSQTLKQPLTCDGAMKEVGRLVVLTNTNQPIRASSSHKAVQL